MHKFRADPLDLNNALGSLPFQKTDPHSLSIHCLPVILHVVMGLSEISPIHVYISIGVAIIQQHLLFKYLLFIYSIILILKGNLTCHVYKTLSCNRYTGPLVLILCLFFGWTPRAL